MSNTPSKDPLGNPVSVSASLDDGKLSVAAQSRFVSSVDRLGGSLVDLVIPYLEGWSKKKRQKNAATQVLSEVELSAALKELEGDPSNGQRALVRLLKDSGRRQENLDAVLIQTADELKQLPPPAENEIQDEREQLDPDWMNAFEGYAVNASSDHLRTLWARVLAGEIRKPASFSRTTLRLISEVDQPIAEAFERKLVLSFQGYGLVRLVELAGEELSELLFLEEVGLLQDSAGNIGFDLDRDGDDLNVIVNGSQALLYKLNTDLRIDIIPFTRAGREVASLIPRTADDHVLRLLCKHYDTLFDKAYVAEFVMEKDNKIHTRNPIVLK